MGHRINIKCFSNAPSINSSLKFLRKTAWARQKVQAHLHKKIFHPVWKFESCPCEALVFIDHSQLFVTSMQTDSQSYRLFSS
ncbi:MAG: VF530 family DNA-binding protein [Proteobacteria bacterium]|nr:VF530 family DNA-binding protein [Pseudomonadota bacterium]